MPCQSAAQDDLGATSPAAARAPALCSRCASLARWRDARERRARAGGRRQRRRPVGAAATPIATRRRSSSASPPANQAERSATFAGEMTAIAGAARMAMRIELLERTPGEDALSTRSSRPGLGVWRSVGPGREDLQVRQAGHQPRPRRPPTAALVALPLAGTRSGHDDRARTRAATAGASAAPVDVASREPRRADERAAPSRGGHCRSLE